MLLSTEISCKNLFGTYHSLMREWNEEVFLWALGIGHVLFPVVKLIVAGLGASNELTQKSIL